MDTVKAIIVIGSLGRGGSEHQIVQFVEATHPNRAECVVVCLGEPGELAARVEAVGARVIALRIRGLKHNPVRSFGRFVRLLRDERPGVVYGFLFHGSALGFLVSAVVRPSALRVLACRSDPKLDGCPTVARPIRSVVIRLADGAIANSDAVASDWCRDSPRLVGRMATVPNGIQVAHTDSTRQASGPVRVVCVANLIPYKGHDTLVRAAARVAASRRDWSLQLVGDGPERGRLEQQVAAAGLTGLVTFLGSRGDVPDILANAHIAVLPSYTEGMPNAVMEAMAHGLPVVATAVGGVGQLVDDRCAIIVQPRDEVALAGALTRMLDDPALRIAMGTHGRQRARAEFGIDRMVEATLDAFERFREGRS